MLPVSKNIILNYSIRFVVSESNGATHLNVIEIFYYFSLKINFNIFFYSSSLVAKLLVFITLLKKFL